MKCFALTRLKQAQDNAVIAYCAVNETMPLETFSALHYLSLMTSDLISK